MVLSGIRSVPHGRTIINPSALRDGVELLQIPAQVAFFARHCLRRKARPVPPGRAGAASLPVDNTRLAGIRAVLPRLRKVLVTFQGSRKPSGAIGIDIRPVLVLIHWGGWMIGDG